MALDADPRTWLHSMTKPQGVLLAAPIIFGVAIAFTLLTGGEPSIARDKPLASDASPITTTGLPAATLANDAADAAPQPIQLAAADKPAQSASFSDAQREEIGKIVRQYLLENPEILVEVSAELERRRKQEQEGNQAKLLQDEKKSIFRSPHDFVLGNPDGDITIVEYFDYNCGWCKRALNEVNTLTERDKNVRIVMKEFPIFGEDSTFAAKAALASIKQGKYWEFHTAMMKAKRVTTQNTMDIAKSVGIDVEELKKEMAKPQYNKAIEENSRIAQALGMQGTPGFIVDDKVNFGYVPADGLSKMLADIRKQGCKIC
jgi:protein-disulfide isomerase